MTRDEIARQIIELLLPLSPDDRREVIASLRNNGIFCGECGWGSVEHPNPHCQCWNDE